MVGPEFFGLIEEIKNDIPTVKKILTVGSHEEWEDYYWRDSHDDVDPMLESKGEDDVIQLIPQEQQVILKASNLLMIILVAVF